MWKANAYDDNTQHANYSHHICDQEVCSITIFSKNRFHLNHILLPENTFSGSFKKNLLLCKWHGEKLVFIVLLLCFHPAKSACSDTLEFFGRVNGLQLVESRVCVLVLAPRLSFTLVGKSWMENNTESAQVHMNKWCIYNKTRQVKAWIWVLRT